MRLHRETSEARVIVVCQGEVMEAFRTTIERLTPHEYADWTRSEDPSERINNGQVFHFSRRDPTTGQLNPYLSHWRSISTSDLSLCDASWRHLRRPVLTNA